MRTILLAAGAAMLLLSSMAARAAPADEVRALVQSGRSAEAYALARRHPEELGKPEFDFYYGIAATDTGHAGEGVLALERYVVQFPDNDQARLELARAYFVLGELVRAREEFETVSRKKPPAAVQATIDRFMDSIRSQETRYTTTATGYIEIGGGYDSNVNSGVGGPSVNVPAGVINVVPAGVKTADSFLHLGAGGQISHPVAPGVSVIGGGSFEGKLHKGRLDREFDQLSYSAYAGASLIRDKDLYRLTGSYSQLEVDYRSFREVKSAGAEWHRQVDELNTASLFGQYAKLEYPRQAVRDSDFYGLGIGWRRALLMPIRPVLQAQLLFGAERNDAGRDDLSRNLVTLRGSASITPAPLWGVSAALTYTRSDYRATDPVLGGKREDNYYGFEAGVSYKLSKPLTLRADYLHSDNNSNLNLFEYKRDVVTVRARYEF